MTKSAKKPSSSSSSSSPSSWMGKLGKMGIAVAVVVAAVVVVLYLPDSKATRPAAANQAFRLAEQHQREGHVERSIAVLGTLVSTYDSFPEGHYTLAIYQRSAGMYEQARDHNLRAIELQPNFPEAYINLGICYELLGDRVQARASYEKALELRPKFYEALDSLAILTHDEGKVDESRRWYARALEVRDSDAVRIKMALMLPPVYNSAEEVSSQWEAVGKRLQTLLKRPQLSIADAQQNVGMAPFYLAYTGFNNKKHMETLHKVMVKADPKLLYTSPHLREFADTGLVTMRELPLTSDNKIRVGIISRHLRWHSIGKLMRGFVQYLPRENIELHVLLPPQRRDNTTQYIMDWGDRFHALPNHMDGARIAVADLRLHAILYPDIGMESFTYYLAFARLAPVQLVTHGHPCTTGLPTIDAFVSFSAYETKDNQQFYTEKLELIAGLSSRYIAPEIPPAAARRADFGLSAQDHLFLIPQSLFKFHPDYDAMLLGVLRADSMAKIAIIDERHAGWSKVLMKRLEAEGKATEEELARIVFLPRASNVVFLSYILMVDVVLDTYPFGGDTSSRETLLMGRPLVTMPAAQIAGRYSQAFLRKVGASDLITSSPSQYIDVAVAMVTNSTWREDVTKRIKKNKMQLFEQQDVLDAWEALITGKVRKVMPSWTPNRR